MKIIYITGERGVGITTTLQLLVGSKDVFYIDEISESIRGTKIIGIDNCKLLTDEIKDTLTSYGVEYVYVGYNIGSDQSFRNSKYQV